jgi:hypothetical protein
VGGKEVRLNGIEPYGIFTTVTINELNEHIKIRLDDVLANGHCHTHESLVTIKVMEEHWT